MDKHFFNTGVELAAIKIEDFIRERLAADQPAAADNAMVSVRDLEELAQRVRALKK